MKTQNQIKRMFILISSIALCIAFLVENLCNFPYQLFVVSLLLGIFGSSLVSFALSIILYREEAKKEVLRICVLSAKAQNLYSVYREQYSFCLAQHTLPSVIDSLNRLRIETLDIRHEIIQFQFAENWTKNSTMSEDILSYCDLLSEVANQCELTNKYIYYKINPESNSFDKSDENTRIVNENYNMRLEHFTVKFDDFAGNYVGKASKPSKSDDR